MFYIKAELTEGITLEIDLLSANTYTRCPKCGDEHCVDIYDLLQDERFDLYSTQIYCQPCSQKHQTVQEI